MTTIDVDQEQDVREEPTSSGTRLRRKFFQWQKFRADVPIYVIMIILCTLIIIPFIWMVLTSFKPAVEVFSYPPQLLPERWTLGMYRSLLVYPGLDKKDINDLIAQGVDMTDVLPTRESFGDGSRAVQF